MDVSYYNYRKMNESLRKDIRHELEKLLSLDSDEELFMYQYKNEKRLGSLLGKGHAIGTSSGTAALQFSLLGLDVGKGDDVVTVSNTFIATLLSISNTGARPVLVDVDPGTMLMDSDLLEEKMTPKTKAIIPVHLHGQMANMDKIQKIAKKHGLYLVEDACQAHLARYNSKLPGALSDAACYSFFPNKNLGGISNGGMVVTRHNKLYKKVEILRNPTSNDNLLLKSMRTPAYLDWSQIAFLNSRMKYLKRWTAKRRDIARRYIEGLDGLPVTLPGADKKAYHVFRDFVIRVSNRGKLARFLRRNGVHTRIPYPQPTHLSKTFKYLGYKKGDLPVTEAISATALSLPINPFISDEEVDYVISKVKKFFE